MNKVLMHLFTDALFTVNSSSGSSVAILILALLGVCVRASLCCETVCMRHGHFPLGFYVL